MKLAVTADLHLTSIEENPERFETLKRILQQCEALSVELLVIAGDLFNRQQQNFGDFERILSSCRHENLQVLVIPGNHDPELHAGHFSVAGLDVISEPTLRTFEQGQQILFVPYQSGASLGQLLSEFQAELDSRRWSLISHADWLGGIRQPSPNEPGVYMPLTNKDLQLFQPSVCLLGHIHRPLDDGRVHYAGSPCPLDVTETGPRRLLIFDTATGTVETEWVESPVVYFDETILMLPLSDENDYLRRQLVAMKSDWHIPSEWLERVQLRLQLIGYSLERSGHEELIRSCLDDINFYPGSPDLSKLKLTLDPDRNEIAMRTKEAVERMDVAGVRPQLSKQVILEKALSLIYEK